MNIILLSKALTRCLMPNALYYNPDHFIMQPICIINACILSLMTLTVLVVYIILKAVLALSKRNRTSGRY
jgi:hypothetical protein